MNVCCSTTVCIPVAWIIGMLLTVCVLLAVLITVLLPRAAIYRSTSRQAKANAYMASAALCFLAMQFSAFLAGALW